MALSLYEFFESTYLLERSLADESIRQLRMSLRMFIDASGDIDIDDLQHVHLNKWAMENPRGWSPSTMRRRVADILSIWNYAYEIGMTENRPNTKRLRRVVRGDKIPEAWTLEELKRIVDSARKKLRYLPNGIRAGDLIESIVYVGFYSCLRPQDLMTLLRSSLDPLGAFVPQKKKHGSGVLIIIPRWVIDFIDERYPKVIERVFAWPFRRECFYRLWHEVVHGAGLPCGKRHGLQKLRRTGVSYGEAAKAGYGAQLAGHVAGSRVTVKHYIDPRILLNGQDNLLPDLRVSQ